MARWSRQKPRRDPKQAMRDAARVGIDVTLLETVEHAKANHPWQNRTFSLLRSHQQLPARIEGNRVRGTWGVGEPYGFWLEVGTSTISGFSWLRPAGDATYPRLAANIRAERERRG